eukprot:COSAG02_NODE_5390_length_4373_cov_2.880440_2_plen_36_part_00
MGTSAVRGWRRVVIYAFQIGWMIVTSAEADILTSY